MNANAMTRSAARGFFARLAHRIRSKLRRLFGKTDDPNIYPYF